MSKGHRRVVVILVALLALPLVVLWRPLCLGETFYREDLAAQYFPREQLLRQTGPTGWNTHIFMGMGLTSDPQTAAYEPVRAFSRRSGLSDRMGLVIYVGLYLAIATIGVWMLARRLGASLAGAALAVLASVWGGMYIVRFRHPWMFPSMALIPWAWDWLRMLAPDIYGNDLAGTHFGTSNYHEQTCYLGITPLALFVLALWWRPRRVELRLAGIAVGFFTLAAGRFLPLFYVAYFVVPGFRLFRCACRYSWFFILLGGVIAGLVLTRIGRGELPPDRARTQRRIGRLLIALAIILGAWAVVALLWTRLDHLTKPGAHLTSAWAAARAAVVILATRALLVAWLGGHLSPRSTVRGLIALTCVDLAAQWLPYRQTRPPSEVFPNPTIVAALASASPGRVLVSAFNTRDTPTAWRSRTGARGLATTISVATRRRRATFSICSRAPTSPVDRWSFPMRWEGSSRPTGC